MKVGTKSEKTGVRKRSKPAMKAHLLALVREMPHCWKPLHVCVWGGGGRVRVGGKRR